MVNSKIGDKDLNYGMESWKALVDLKYRIKIDIYCNKQELKSLHKQVKDGEKYDYLIPHLEGKIIYALRIIDEIDGMLETMCNIKHSHDILEEANFCTSIACDFKRS